MRPKNWNGRLPRSGVVVTLVNSENYLLFTPMLHEVAGGELEAYCIVNPVAKCCGRSFCGDVPE